MFSVSSCFTALSCLNLCHRFSCVPGSGFAPAEPRVLCAKEYVDRRPFVPKVA
jgi:hypothetical protein